MNRERWKQTDPLPQSAPSPADAERATSPERAPAAAASSVVHIGGFD